jgi:hypothetical protein
MERFPALTVRPVEALAPISSGHVLSLQLFAKLLKRSADHGEL